MASTTDGFEVLVTNVTVLAHAREIGFRTSADHCDVGGLHVYTFNRVQPTMDRLQELRRHASVTNGKETR